MNAGHVRAGERGDALVIFGLTGDLGAKKLFPALLELQAAGRLPPTVVGVGHGDRSDEQLRAMLVDAAETDADRAAAERIELRYLSGDAAEDDTYDRLAAMLDGHAPVVYAALPPSLFGAVAAGVRRLGDAVRLVVEKPFGSDAASAVELHDQITEHIDESRLFLVDHFLAKSSVENIMTLRRANPWIDASLRSGSVEHVEVTMAESFGVDGRGSFYDGVGALRDVVQNHLLALVSVLAMEPVPIDDADAFAESRRALLEAIRPLEPADVTLGQFVGYLDEEGVEAGSVTETYVSARLVVDNERWDGVPFHIRTGKCLARTETEAVATFAGVEGVETSSRLRVAIRPESEITLDLNVLDSEHHDTAVATLVACGPTGHDGLSDYAVMLDGALDGDRRHFATIADVVAGWRVVEPALALDRVPLPYEAGSDGPVDDGR